MRRHLIYRKRIVKKNMKKALVLLIISLVMVLVGSAAAAVARINFVTERGELSGLFYKPEGADSEARPPIVAELVMF